MWDKPMGYSSMWATTLVVQAHQGSASTAASSDSLPLNAAEDQTFGEVLLQEGIHNEHWYHPHE